MFQGPRPEEGDTESTASFNMVPVARLSAMLLAIEKLAFEAPEIDQTIWFNLADGEFGDLTYLVVGQSLQSTSGTPLYKAQRSTLNVLDCPTVIGLKSGYSTQDFRMLAPFHFIS
jgi:hypothetical protein